MWENRSREDLFAHHRVRIGGISGKQSTQNPWRIWSGCYIQYWSCWEQRVASEVLRCKGNSAQCREIARGGTCLPTQESISNGFWQTEYTESIENMFLMIYPVLG